MKELVKADWYKQLVDDCKTIITESVFTSRWALVKGYHQLGERIREDNNVKEYAKGSKTFVQDLARNLNISDRTLYYSLQLYDKYPKLDKLPEGKNISWNKLITKHLPAPKENKLTIPLPEGKYSIIYADPPWQFDNAGFTESAESHYPTMSTNQICQMPILDLCTNDTTLFLWATNAMLEDALKVIKEWGFNYKSNMVWIKDKGPSIGWFVQSRHELLLIATKPNNLHPKIKPTSWFKAQVTKHSEKPDLVYDLIEKMYDGPYLELFARRRRKNWQTYGNEIPEDKTD
ncbi:MAG: MT-A70 family methyltransferase [Planctomycetota bacterium]|nr:MT-A70 family methyltransferase [Planctomycetota bacterium]